ncbi:MAG: Plug domain-containing protein, partial [Bacteroidetes bacterium]
MLKRFLSVLSLAVSLSGMAQIDSTNKRLLDSAVVSGVLAKPKYPVTQINLLKEVIKQRYYGADIPTLLCSTPSFNAYSDNGTGIGYSTYRLRGLDATRINFTINGIPVNDPENQGV